MCSGVVTYFASQNNIDKNCLKDWFKYNKPILLVKKDLETIYLNFWQLGERVDGSVEFWDYEYRLCSWMAWVEGDRFKKVRQAGLKKIQPLFLKRMANCNYRDALVAWIKDLSESLGVLPEMDILKDFIINTQHMHLTAMRNDWVTLKYTYFHPKTYKTCTKKTDKTEQQLQNSPY
ncbi:hypothetical protein BC830DRAFT_1080550 [Chytriomyces sp. MP71]|nr:hypothetical protein BC830DRAFT_1080550 [Chytriomyces sp. MP71]